MVKLVEYAESSDDDALDNHSNDGSQWSSFGEIPSSPSDSFSYPMESLDSEEEDEDYAPSRTSLDVSGSVTSSMDTDDLNPDNDMDEELLEEEEENCNSDNSDNQENVKNVKNEKNDEVFYEWKELQTAFEISAFKKRGVDTFNSVDEHKVPDEGTEQVAQDDTVEIKSTLLNVEMEKSSFPALFAPGIAEKKTKRPHRRKMPTMTQPTGVSPRFSTLLTGKQQQHTVTKDTDFFPIQYAEPSSEKHTKILQVNGQTNETAGCSFQPSQVETPAFSFGAKQTDAKTPDFTFGKPGAAVFGEPSNDSHMRSPSPKSTAAVASFVPIEGGFTLGQSGKNPKPYKFYNFGNSGSEAVGISAKVLSTTNGGDDACMRSPSAHGKPASQKPTTGKFLFGQAYKNRKSHAFSRQKSNESLGSTESVFTPIIAPPTGVPGVLWGTKDPFGDTSSGNFGANSASTAASTFFSTGVVGPNMQHRNSDRRKKKGSSSLTFAPILESNSSRSQSFASSSTFKSSLSQSATATATSQQSNTMFAGGNAHESSERPSNMASAVPTKKSFITNTGGLFDKHGNSNAKTSPETFPKTDSSSLQTDESGPASSSAAPATSNAGVPGQVSRDEGVFRNAFEFGCAETNMPTEGANPYFPADNITIGSFQIGSHDARKNPRVRPRRSGMFTHKNSPRQDAKVDATEPEPSPGFCSVSSSTPSPFGMHHRRTRKNARLRKCGRSSPADHSVKRAFQCGWSSPSSDGQLHSHSAKPTATTGFGSTIGATSTSNTDFGAGTTQQQDQSGDPGENSHPQRATSSTLQPQNLSHPPIFQQNGLSKSVQIQQTCNGGTRPAYAGSRRILRAALRSVGVSGDRPGSAPPIMSNYDEGDAEMNSDDEQDWFELKRLGGVAYSSKQYEDAAEYYRQSIELLDLLSDDDTVMYTTEMRADKAKLHANRAASLMMLMQIAEAQRECRRSIEVDATYARAYLRLGRIQVLLGDAANAQANIDTARHLMEGPDNKVSSGDEADYASLTKMEAKIKKLTTLQGEIKWHVDSGDFKQALVQTNVALALAPNSRKLQVEKARILLRQKKLDQVIEFYTSIIEKQQASQGKMSSPASTSGANTKPLKNKIVEKIAMIGIELGLLWATTLHYQNKAEDAVQILDALEVVAPCSSHVIQLKRQWQDMKQLKHDGNERFKQGKYQEAVRFYSEAVQIDPQHQEYCAIIYCNRSAAQMGLERYHTAVLDCNEALKRKPNFQRALLRRARCHVALKMYHEAVKDFERYLREQPGNVPADATSDVRRERNEAKAAIAKAREEVRQREAAKKRAERQQRHQHSRQREESSWNDSRFHGNYRRGVSSNNGGGYSSNNAGGYSSSRFQSSGGSSRASYMAPKTQRRTYYDVLGIEKTSTVSQIRKAYRKLALVYHPDKTKTPAHGDLFKEMTAAYNVLSDESARAKYDRGLVYNRFGNFYEN